MFVRVIFITGKHLPRRTLRAAGVTMGLPLLKTAANPKLRLGFCYIPRGAVMAAWTPEKEGAGFELSRILAPVTSVFLNGARHRRTEREDVRTGVTVDQIAAGAQTVALLKQLEAATAKTGDQ